MIEESPEADRPEPGPEAPGGKPAGPRRAGPAIAVIGLVVAVVPCCPFTGLIGAMLGVLALRVLRGHVDPPPPPIYRRLAIAAMIAGIVSALVWSTAFDWWRRGQVETQQETMIEQMTAVIGGPDPGAGGAAEPGRLWPGGATAGGGTTPDDEEVREFRREVSTRYGDLDRVTIISTVHSGPFLNPVIEVACVFQFAGRSPLGSARFNLRVRPGGWKAVPVLRALTLEDDDAGDLHLAATSD